MSCCLSTLYPCFPTHFWSVDPDAKVPAWRELAQKTGDKDARWKLVKIKGHDDETGQVCSRERVLDMVTGDLYLKDPLCSVRIKSALITLFSCFYGAATMGVEFVKVVWDVAKLALDIFCALAQCSCSKVLTIVEQHFAADLGSDLFTLVASPLYWLGLELGAVIGIFAPYEGRKIMARIEMSWHRAKSYKEDFRFTPFIEKRNMSLYDVTGASSGACFIGFCLLVRGNLEDKLADGKQKYEIEKVEDITGCC